MRKYVFIVLTIIFLGSSVNQEVCASPDEHRELRNLLDLSSLVYDFDNEYYYTNKPIVLEKDCEYTLLADMDFIGNNSLTFYIKYDNYGEHIEFEACDDLYYFTTFIPKEDQFNITEFEFSGRANHNIMLFEGDTNRFEDVYHPYLPEDNFEYGLLIVDYDKPLTVKEIDGYIKAYNGTTNEAVEVIKSANRYKHEIGSTFAKYYAIVNKTTSVYYLDIQVVDLTAPVIVTDSLTYSYKNPPTIDKIIDDIKMTDNVNKREELELIELVDNYSNNIKHGESEIIITVSDRAKNTTRKAIKINLNDNVPPVISGPEAIFVYSTNEPLTNEEIKAKIKATDEITNLDNITIAITRNEYLQTKVPGSYPIEITATDESGNQTVIEIIIHVIGNEMAFFTVDKAINTTKKALVSEEEIIQTFINEARLKGINVSRDNVFVDKTIYDMNYNKPGEYTAYIEYITDDEKINYSEVKIFVNDTKTKVNYIYLIPIIVVMIPSALIIIKKNKRKFN